MDIHGPEALVKVPKAGFRIHIFSEPGVLADPLNLQFQARVSYIESWFQFQ